MKTKGIGKPTQAKEEELNIRSRCLLCIILINLDYPVKRKSLYSYYLTTLARY